ncbi:hypothetical protein AMS68_005051 [Peltaster fructicola]|uniref:Pre-rRNA-processing protein RIX1 n=1 Tax=Peltaster fructicola TaxID=286661 RepID=A0A6H0XXS6_9PEZI|nr:hypothetical protein AMS68_005051 [Peltaster fructicola]
MAQKAKLYAVSALKALTYRIASTPTAQLPRCAAQLASAIWISRDILSTPADTLKQDAELSVVVHRFKTQLSALLQDRTIEGRWAALVLVKAAIEAGGVEILSKSQAWIRNILGILKKPDPSTTKCLAVLTLTRVFMLTWDYSNLVREITTPTLPTFVSACLNNAENPRSSNQELQCILEAFETLIPHHPTIFRSHESALRTFLVRVISSSASVDSHCFTPQHVVTAQRVLVLLSFCAPKQAGAEKWDESLQNTIKAAHQACDIVLSPVLEVWRSNIETYRDHASARSTTTQVEQDQTDHAGLNAWSGGFAGAERLKTLVDLITAHVQTASPGPVQLRIGMIWDLAFRLLSVTVPGSKQKSLQTNPQMSAATRETLYATLPAIHEHVLSMLAAMFCRLEGAMVSTVPTVLEVIAAVFASSSFDMDFRNAVYSLVQVILQQAGHSLSKDNIADLAQIMITCCNDLLPTQSAAHEPKSKPQGADLVLQTSKTGPSNPAVKLEVHLPASQLLPVLLSKLDTAKVPRKIRIQMDRTAILTKHKEGLLASVLNPPPGPSGYGLQSSLLPLLARLYPTEPEVEALIRPRMPLVVSKKAEAASEDDDVSESEQEEDEAEPELPQEDADVLALDHESAAKVEPPSQIVQALAKRMLSEDDSHAESAKRPRHITASSQIQSEWDTALSKADHAHVEHQTTVATSVPALSDSATEGLEVAGGDEDESDFEMPPLTMEQDTEDEDD